ncbi:MAG: patatin-like phospholipase family protein [Candidatus Marinimicrobia bacterium]|nr:patatin-like phospholipase family protein [Candidatus Neomarinimicrobiota bacterium]MCF7922542.1 patatin-like phospholipase family protein [Candidatus Neomarinimicrobiota bacterium]
MSRPKFGLALGGGGARGFVHIGVLQRLEEIGIRPDIITGSSMGALVAATYIKTGSADATWTELDRMTRSEAFRKLGMHLINVKGRGGDSFWHQVSAAIQDRIVINLAHSKPGLVQADRVKEAIKVVVTEDSWSDSGTELGIVATDLYSGEDVYFTEGPLLPAVMASIAIPGFLPPVYFEGKTLVDGGVSQQVPIRMAREMGADFVLAVDVGQDIHPIAEMDNAMAIMSQCENIRSCHYRDMLNREADVLLLPEMPGVHWSAYEQRETFIDLGIAAFDKRRVTVEQGWYQTKHPIRGWLKNLLR